MTLKQWEWIASSVSIMGTILNAFLRIEGFYFWIFGNTIWIYVGCKRKMYGVVMMFSVYLIISFVGIYYWWGK